MTFDIVIIGGSLGGVQAARAACSHGLRVLLCEETDWIGGQLTSQAVPPDEHPWIEETGATESYRAYRRSVREAYRNMPEASEALRTQTRFCPGNSWVSRLAHDPRLAHRLLTESLQPFLDRGTLTLLTHTVCTAAETRDDTILSVTLKTGSSLLRVQASYFLDATDTGELLPLTGTEYRIGAESREETGEPHAPETAMPDDQQPVTWVAALQLDPVRKPMEKPASYDHFRQVLVHGVPLLGWQTVGARGLQTFAMFDHTPGAVPLGLWSYRRIQYPPYYTDGRPEISLLNWPQNDYVFGNLIDDPRSAFHREQARELTRCCAFWLWEQGYPVSFAGDVLGTEDGLAKSPYIRESRRIVAKTTIVEQKLTKACNPEPRKRKDSVGVGHYAIDLHTTTKTHLTMYEATQPFEIPLGALVPVRMRNLIPACKNIGATHLTGGCFRLHPVEWTVGEAAGHLAAFCVLRHMTPLQVYEDCLSDFQALLVRNGFQLHWPDPLPDPA